MMARALKIDPVEFRRKNLMREGRPHATGQMLQGRADREGDGHGARAHELVAAVRQSGSGPVKRGRGFAIAIKAVISPTTSVAIVNVSADGSATLYCGTVDMGQGSDTAMAQMVGEVLNIPAEIGARGAARHRRDALRHGHARLALAVPHGPRGAPRRRGCARQAEGAGEGGRRAGGLQHPDRRAVPEALRHAGRQRHRHRHLQAGLRAARARHRAEPERHAVLDDLRRRRRGRGRHRDRPRQDRPSSSTWSTAARRSIRRAWRRRFPARR